MGALYPLTSPQNPGTTGMSNTLSLLRQVRRVVIWVRSCEGWTASRWLCRVPILVTSSRARPTIKGLVMEDSSFLVTLDL